MKRLLLLIWLLPSLALASDSGSQYIKISPFGRTLVDDEDALSFRTTLGIDDDDEIDFGSVTLSGDLISAGLVRLGETQSIQFSTTRARISSPADSQVLLTNAAANNFDKLLFGGTSASYAALGRNGTGITVVRADGGAYTDLLAGNLRAVNGYVAVKDSMAAPATVAGVAHIYVDSADGDLKIKFGDGTVKVITTNP